MSSSGRQPWDANDPYPEPVSRSYPDSSMLILNGEPTFDQWITELEHVAGEWDAKHGNLPYTLPLRDSTGVGCWHDFFEDGLTPQEAFDSDQSHWDAD